MIRGMALIALLLSGCARTATAAKAGEPCIITDQPVVQRRSIGWHLFDSTVVTPVASVLNPVVDARRLLRLPAQSVNLRNGQVPNTSFFEDRDIAAMSLEQIQAGPTGAGDRAQGPFTVTKWKEEGKTAGMFVTDAKGDRYLFKLDQTEYPELLSGAEAVSSKLLHALGYYVPSYEIEMVPVDQLRPGPKLAEHPEDEEEFREEMAEWSQDGMMRVSSSRLLEGEILGPIAFKHYRCCAELRALRLAYAWVNNTDSKDHNSLIVRRPDGAIIGYLIDFGSSLGADAERGPKAACFQGWIHEFDMREGMLDLLTFGRHNPGCPVDEEPRGASVGLFSPNFSPTRWKAYAPNIAFAQMTREDGRWIAGRLAQFSREQLASTVAAGRYSNADDAAWITEVLDARRKAIIKEYLDDADTTPDAAE